MENYMLKSCKNIYILFIFLISLCTGMSASAKEAVRIKDLAVIQGIKENQLMGFGLVTGLQGQGDSKNFVLTRKMLTTLAENYGFQVAEEDIKSKNVAAVLVTANLGGFTRIGDSLDVTISSIGDAKSLSGGILLLTALKAANGDVYAVAQGRIIAGNRSQKSETSGSIPRGAIIEKEVVSSFMEGNKLSIILKNPDFSTANLIREAILTLNQELAVTAKDPGLVEVELGQAEQENPVLFISQLELLTVIPDYAAVVIIDKKTGVIVTGSDVIIQECTVSTPSAEVRVGSAGSSKKNNIAVESKTVGELVSLLNQAELKTDEIIALLEAIQKIGAMNAKLIIL